MSLSVDQLLIFDYFTVRNAMAVYIPRCGCEGLSFSHLYFGLISNYLDCVIQHPPLFPLELSIKGGTCFDLFF